MGNMDGWDLALLAAAAYLAVTALVRMMVRRRDQMLTQLREEVARQKQRKEAAEQATKRRIA